MSEDIAAANAAAIRQLEQLGARPQHYPEDTASGAPPTTQAATEPPAPKLEDPRRRRHYRFTLQYRDGDDKLWEGAFLSVMPSIAQDIEIAKRIAKMRHGEGELPQETEQTIYALCFMEACLVERPAWANSLGDLVEPQLFDALAREVSAHMATFQLRRQRQKQREA